jgi:hypothetical protein
LQSQGFQVGATTVRVLLAELGYSLQANRKMQEGMQHPDRDAQFEHIDARVKARKRRSVSATTRPSSQLPPSACGGRSWARNNTSLASAYSSRPTAVEAIVLEVGFGS